MAAIPMTKRIAINLVPSFVKDSVLGRINNPPSPPLIKGGEGGCLPICLFFCNSLAKAVSQGSGADRVRWKFIDSFEFGDSRKW